MVLLHLRVLFSRVQGSNTISETYTGTFFLNSSMHVYRDTTLDVSGDGFGGTSNELLLVSAFINVLCSRYLFRVHFLVAFVFFVFRVSDKAIVHAMKTDIERSTRTSK